MDFIVETRQEGHIMASYGCEGFLGGYERKVRDGFFFCRAGIEIGSILADGSIGACPNINRDFCQGNINEDSFISIWENKYSVMRDRSWMHQGICKECPSFKDCRGNGMHLHKDTQSEVLHCHMASLQSEC